MPSGYPIDLRPKLRELIQAAQTRGETTIPSAREQARRWGALRSTVNRAVTRLVSEGLLSRQGQKLSISQSASPLSKPSEPPFLIHSITDQHPKWLHELFESRNCAPVFHIWTDITQCWGLIKKTNRTPCEGVILAIPEIIQSASAHRIIEELAERGIPLVLNRPMGRSNLVVSDLSSHPDVMRQLVEAGHRQVLVPYASGEHLKRSQKLFGYAGIPSIFEDFGLHVFWEPLGRAPSKRTLGEVLTRHVSGRAGVTAIYCYEQETAVRCCETARDVGIKIPADLSVVLVQQTDGSTPGSQPVSTWWLNTRTGPRLAIDLLVNQIREIRATGKMPGPESIRGEPVFIDRGTFGPAPGHKGAPSSHPATPAEIWQSRWPEDPERCRRLIAETNTAPYAAAFKAKQGDWQPVGLDGIFNRQFAREHGWAGGLPLLHLPRGRQQIHGVPFQVAGSPFSQEPDCLVMASSHAHTGKGRKLPSEIALKIGRKVRAVYFLHGCGWASGQKPFAHYDFHYADRTVAAVPLEPYKSAPPSGSTGRARVRGNIQDWWSSPAIPQFKSVHARHCVVTDNGDPVLYERYLYTLEWINPHPDRTIGSLVIRSDPKAEATLGVLAITLQALRSMPA